ncbi:HAD hydrolase-like protein [Oerskovia sp. NPDC060287]|uniref:HAD hydrolase-like protein n=1 Tax=Oerskovia sp. NPDC060287 TaxID=3347095 RepID=UPI00365BEEED
MTTANPPYRLALLDLDGTLTDSAPGILSSVRHAYATLGIETPTDETLRRFVGPPLHETFALHGVPVDRVPEALAAYREVYAAGAMLDNSLYPGILECLTAARAAGVRLAVATSKPEVYARRITAHFGIDDLVEGVYGATLDGSRGTKADVIEHALASLAVSDGVAVPAASAAPAVSESEEAPGAGRVGSVPDGLPPREEIVMVGDREHDVLGAAAHGIGCLGVSWGYAEPGELEDAGALAVVASADELARALRGE